MPVTDLPIYRTEGRAMGVVFEHLNVFGATASTDGILDLPALIYKILNGNRPVPSRAITQDVTGALFPGEMMLVLGRPGSGCSTVLKTLANNHDSFLEVQANLCYGSIPSNKMHGQYRSETVYVGEDDIHFPTLSMGKTIQFGYRLRKPSSERKRDAAFASEQSDKMLEALGISHTKDTVVGDAFVRGVSGGERKRITLAEAFSINSAYASWDNPIRGLDSSSAIQFLRLLKAITQRTGMANSVSLYQASENMYQECFDRVMVLYEGRMIFCGKSTEAKAYFEDLGYECLERQTTPDFLTAVTSPTERRINPQHKGPVPVEPDSMAQAFRNSDYYRQLLDDIDRYYSTVSDQKEYTGQFKEITQSLRSRLTLSSAIAPRSVFSQAWVAICRYYQLLWGSRTTFYTTLVFNAVNAVINGSAYYMSPQTATGSFQKSGALFFSLIYFFLNALTEVAATVNSRSVLLKQLKYGFIHPSAYVFAQTIADIPVAAFQCIIFSCIYYFMLGLRLDASDFWTFALFVFVHYGAAQAMFRMLGAWSPNRSIALLMAGSGMPVALSYSGYSPTNPTMHRWGSWIRRISPSPWALEALMANEFADVDLYCTDDQMVPSGPKYNEIAYQGCSIAGSQKGSNTVSGTTYLARVYQYFPWHIWRNLGIILVLWFLYTVLAAIGLTLMTRESGGSYARVFKNRQSPDTPRDSGDPEKQGGIQASAASSDTEDGFDNATPIPNKGSFFTFKDLSYFVNVGGSEKQLLTHVNGYVLPGQLTALMGASGAGKTTLLDTLSQRKSQGRVEGQLLLNGKPLDQTFSRSCGFVMQQDVHEPSATVREALQFSARLRQPEGVPDSERMAYVEHVIRLLDLEQLAEALVGETGDGQLSVEERKRVTIGVELAARPSALLFLDEPTSGLDSQAAYSLVSFLQRIAAEGLPIICAIHQPSGVLFNMFDHILLLAPGGKTVFFGETGENSCNVVQYFSRYGSVIGEKDNPAEFILDTVTVKGEGIRDWAKTWDDSPERQALDTQITALNALESTAKETEQYNQDQARQYALPLIKQTVLVTKRHWLAVWRNGPYNFSRLFKSIFCELFLAFTFYKAQTNPQGLQNHMLGLLLLSWIIPATAADIQNIWFQKWSIFTAREKNGIYNWSALLSALIVVEIPWQIAFYTIVFLCSYWTVGYPNTPTVAGFAYFMFLLLSLFGTSYCQLLAAIFPNPTLAGYANSLIWVILMLFSGVLMPHSSMNNFYKPWLFWADPMRYFFGGTVGNVLHNRKAVCLPADMTLFDAPPGKTCGKIRCQDWAVFLGFCLTNVAILYVIMWFRMGRTRR
ncbi:P-loop containing nucleoside triphosphate hydrolase protein [Aspergillus avenaceus]|uniref:P-loop containing nucleoside triphosphate hydrolase protein n=1 Tax=Aspergillus avenaceus TaxID=36643 RepID=A0A5N6U2E4_ASPAV|nr:P-loop containing nucleoside triphosphate hydrolase protein [Aspergillus avenaceus]